MFQVQLLLDNQDLHTKEQFFLEVLRWTYLAYDFEESLLPSSGVINLVYFFPKSRTVKRKKTSNTSQRSSCLRKEVHQFYSYSVSFYFVLSNYDFFELFPHNLTKIRFIKIFKRNCLTYSFFLLGYLIEHYQKYRFNIWKILDWNHEEHHPY